MPIVDSKNLPQLRVVAPEGVGPVLCRQDLADSRCVADSPFKLPRKDKAATNDHIWPLGKT